MPARFLWLAVTYRDGRDDSITFEQRIERQRRMHELSFLLWDMPKVTNRQSQRRAAGPDSAWPYVRLGLASERASSPPLSPRSVSAATSGPLSAHPAARTCEGEGAVLPERSFAGGRALRLGLVNSRVCRGAFEAGFGTSSRIATAPSSATAT